MTYRAFLCTIYAQFFVTGSLLWALAHHLGG